MSTTVCNQVIMYTAEWTATTRGERNCQSFETAEWECEPGFSRSRVRRSNRYATISINREKVDRANCTNLNGKRHQSSCSSRTSASASDMRGSTQETRRLATNTGGAGREVDGPQLLPVATLPTPLVPPTLLPVAVLPRYTPSAMLSRLADDVMFLGGRTPLGDWTMAPRGVNCSLQC